MPESPNVVISEGENLYDINLSIYPSECELICNIGTEGYSINISCESGGTSTTYNDSMEYRYDSNGNRIGIKVNLNQTRTYLNTGNTYTIVGVIEVDLIKNTETHSITVSGGRFANPQTCN